MKFADERARTPQAVMVLLITFLTNGSAKILPAAAFTKIHQPLRRRAPSEITYVEGQALALVRGVIVGTMTRVYPW